jgi:hypothetical protein
MRPLWETVTDLAAGSAVLRRRRYGVIEVADEQLVRIMLRPLPKLVTWPEARLLGRFQHALRRGNACRLYYNEPRSAPGYLALSYLVSTRGATWRTVLGALAVLDEIARIKQSDALVCDVANVRISDRLLARWGWAPLRPRWGHRNFIKRFYGSYPIADMPLSAPATPERLSCDSSDSADALLESFNG